MLLQITIWEGSNILKLYFVSINFLSNIERNLVFVTNSDFLVSMSLQPNAVDLRYFKLYILIEKVIWVWNIKGLHQKVAEIYGLEN